MRSTPPSADLAAEVRAFFGALAIGAGQAMAGWPVLLGRCVFYVLIMLVISALWDRVAAERLPGTLAHALPAGGLALYVGVTEWITLSLPHLHLRFEDDIRRGGLEPHLLRPKSYLFHTLALSLGGALVRLAALGATGIAMLIVSGREGPPLGVFAGLLLVGVLALAVGVLLYALAGLSAFWAKRTLPFQLVVQKLMFLLGGLFAPISLYPTMLREVGEASPFAAHLYWAGVQALEPSLAGFVTALGWQLFWIVLLTLLCLALWRAGLAKVLREGGA
ncbi:ABC-2 family transporter protein [Phenylobacterium terrae]|uniref:ABC-2 family transporter protein n=1 Tax=Phenylobacterium terrae TaxID=2665495 RepID=A0ABW4N5L0_9CAUL